MTPEQFSRKVREYINELSADRLSELEDVLEDYMNHLQEVRETVWARQAELKKQQERVYPGDVLRYTVVGYDTYFLACLLRLNGLTQISVNSIDEGTPWDDPIPCLFDIEGNPYVTIQAINEDADPVLAKVPVKVKEIAVQEIEKTKAGILLIRNLHNGKEFIGYSFDVTNSLKEHEELLENDNHWNQHLQNSYNLYGGENFSFSVVTYCDEDELLSKYKETMVSLVKAGIILYNFDAKEYT